MTNKLTYGSLHELIQGTNTSQNGDRKFIIALVFFKSFYIAFARSIETGNISASPSGEAALLAS